MLLDHFEERFSELGISPRYPRLLLALPLLDCLTADRVVSLDEARKVARFCRGTLAFETKEMQTLHHFLNAPPDRQLVARATLLTADLIATRDVVTIEIQTIRKVLAETERLLRRREVEHKLDNPQGRRRLAEFGRMWGVDLGSPWQDIAPEVFDETPKENAKRPEHDSSPPVRRLRTARRLDDVSPHERGGLV